MPRRAAEDQRWINARTSNPKLHLYEMGEKTVEQWKWFAERKFGVILHYGLYSVLGRGEWVMHEERIPVPVYEKLADRFTARQFDAREIAACAKEAGAGYLILTSRHHDGFCLFDSAVSDFNSVRRGPGRDLIREFVEACRSEGLKVGIYYSLLDWRFKGYHDRRRYPDSTTRMVEQAHAQVRELLSNYGTIDYLWFDGGWFPDQLDVCQKPEVREEMAKLWNAEELLAMIRRLQPEILINDRSGLAGEVKTPEQKTEKDLSATFTEACMTCGDRWGWGYIPDNPVKTTRTILQSLVEQNSFGGNFLLNVGPCPEGEIRPSEKHILSELGQWFRANGASIYGTSATPSALRSILGPITGDGRILYQHIFRWPTDKTAVLSGLYDKVQNVRCLANGRNLPFSQEENGRLVVTDLPRLAPDPLDTVLEITLQEGLRATLEAHEEIGAL